MIYDVVRGEIRTYYTPFNDELITVTPKQLQASKAKFYQYKFWEKFFNVLSLFYSHYHLLFQ